MTQRVRRFDVFAVFNMLKNMATMGEARAKGEAIWLSKVVANHKLYGTPAKASGNVSKHGTKEKDGKVVFWKELSGIPQTDAVYDHDIVDRFGKVEYVGLFKAVNTAMQKGIKYENMRDCKHNFNSGNRFKTGWCAECSKDFVHNFNVQILGK